MDKALKQAKPQLQVSAKDGKVIIIGNQEGLDLLARIVSVASTTPYADAAVGPDGRGIVICAMPSSLPGVLVRERVDELVEMAVEDMVGFYRREFQVDIAAEFNLQLGDAVQVVG